MLDSPAVDKNPRVPRVPLEVAVSSTVVDDKPAVDKKPRVPLPVAALESVWVTGLVAVKPAGLEPARETCGVMTLSIVWEPLGSLVPVGWTGLEAMICRSSCLLGIETTACQPFFLSSFLSSGPLLSTVRGGRGTTDWLAEARLPRARVERTRNFMFRG